ncbi:MAG: DUF2750 domain-containing protein [Polyangiaceae bacterium]
MIELKGQAPIEASLMRHISQRQFEAILGLSGPKRFSHFIKRVADEERAWGLWDDGWALMTNSDGDQVFPLWPASEYADLFRTGEWATFTAKEISLEELLNNLIPKLVEMRALPGVFPTPGGKGITPTPGELATALREELERYG